MRDHHHSRPLPLTTMRPRDVVLKLVSLDLIALTH